MDTTTFLAIYDEFAKVNPLKVDHALSRATNRIDAVEWGVYTEEAVGLLAAHFLASSGSGGNQLGGVITRISIEDDIEVESNSTFKATSDLDLTSYGRQFKELQASVLGRLITCTNLSLQPIGTTDSYSQWI